MPCPHNEISIVQRSHRQSAVAAAAYQSGEKLFCEYDQKVKHYPEKRGIVHNEILLPANAPLEYTDRNTLWNAAEAVEKQWNSQLARRWVLSIPREIPPDQYAALVRDFCRQQFVSKGMCVDFAIHDKGDGNPHAHVMLTMRAMDEHGKWLPKSRKVYDLDENGERIKLPSGRWKSHKEDTVDWNDQKYCEIWRHEWEVIQNRYLEANDRPERVDLRSYARQGLDIIPTVHEGAAVRQMEKRGIQTNIGNLNREIRAANRLMKSIRQLIQNLKGWITELGEKRKELLAQKAAEEATLLPNLLMKYMEIRKEERKDWTRSGQNRGTSQDLKAVSEALSYLQQKGLSTVEDLEAFLESSGKSAADYRNQMKPKEARSKVIDGILASRTDCKECKPVYEKYQKIFFKKTKEKFKQEHSEVARYEKAATHLAKHPDDKDSTQKELQEEQETLLEEIAELKVPLTEVQEDLKKLRDIRYWVRKATPGTEESKEPPKKQPIKEVLQDKADEKKAQRTAPAQAKHRQQDMEL
ncbi:conjugal transfer protein [Blautia obeum]|uniref:Conjugal transfer protein n=2 Tax=Blautia obeum TaxID=40520 RepID=A0A414I645_9FIRM|nr:MobQ family relaxase [Blautia obeum]RHE11265.1 conjugal transfer protein [Blautia obeum]RHL48419.1 conjugal transfer protein [Blautia obeum]